MLNLWFICVDIFAHFGDVACHFWKQSNGSTENMGKCGRTLGVNGNEYEMYTPGNLFPPFSANRWNIWQWTGLNVNSFQSLFRLHAVTITRCFIRFFFTCHFQQPAIVIYVSSLWISNKYICRVTVFFSLYLCAYMWVRACICQELWQLLFLGHLNWFDIFD